MKNALLKQKIIGLCINGDYSIADLSKELNTSIPTTTKLVEELIAEGSIEEMGKLDTNGGRRPSIYGLRATAGYFVGTDVRRDSVSIAICDFKGHIVEYLDNLDFTVESSKASFVNLCSLIIKHLSRCGIDRTTVKAYGFNLSGRVNNETGYCFTYFIGEDRPIASLLEEELQAPVFVENDSRAMTFGEYICGVANNEKQMLFINVTWGLGMGMIIDGKLSYGRSGFSGEIGHFPLLDNDQIGILFGPVEIVLRDGQRVHVVAGVDNAFGFDLECEAVLADDVHVLHAADDDVLLRECRARKSVFGIELLCIGGVGNLALL